MRYPLVLHKDPNSDYGVTVPDLPGCFSSGESVNERLVAQMDRYAAEHGQSRSALIAQAALSYPAGGPG